MFDIQNKYIMLITLLMTLPLSVVMRVAKGGSAAVRAEERGLGSENKRP